MTTYRCRPIAPGGDGVLDIRSELADHRLSEMTYENFMADNERRASFACDGLVAYAKVTKELKGEPFRVVIQDLLADLMHLMDGTREVESDETYPNDFEELLAGARRRYTEEILGRL